VKGFAATPIIFIAVFLITAVLFLHFMDVDKRVAEGIGKESRLLKLQADSLKAQMARSASINSFALALSIYSDNESEMEYELRRTFGNDIDVHDPISGDNRFAVDWAFRWGAVLIDAGMNSSKSATEVMMYPFYELTDAAKRYDYSGFDFDCQTMQNGLNGYLSSNFPSISWNRTYGSCYAYQGYNLKDLFLTSNYVGGTLSEKNQHLFSPLYGGTCSC